MALTNFGKAVVSTIGLGVVGVFITAAAPAFADNDAGILSGNPIQSEYVIAATEGSTVPKLNMLLLPDAAGSETKVG